MALTIGITGGIGAGKSVVSRILRCLGHEVYDCDYEARLLMDASYPLKCRIVGRLGSSCLDSSGELDRAEIARMVFADREALGWLNLQVHALVREDIMNRRDAFGGNLFFVESAILHTSGLDKICDEIWLMEAPESMRIERASARNGVPPEKVMERMEAQKGEFSALADSVPESRIRHILNDGSTPLLPLIASLLKKY